MAESLTLAEKAGVDPSVALTLLNGQSLRYSSESMPPILTAR
jgi:3-hydroxyisobutyrate dehydrogenase-like beta-hydroxyacid dehydrogenase